MRDGGPLIIGVLLHARHRQTLHQQLHNTKLYVPSHLHFLA